MQPRQWFRLRPLIWLAAAAFLIVAPQAVGIMSDWFAGGHGADAASLRLALLVLAPTGFWAVWHFWLAARTVVEDQIRAIGYTTA